MRVSKKKCQRPSKIMMQIIKIISINLLHYMSMPTNNSGVTMGNRVPAITPCPHYQQLAHQHTSFFGESTGFRPPPGSRARFAILPLLRSRKRLIFSSAFSYPRSVLSFTSYFAAASLNPYLLAADIAASLSVFEWLRWPTVSLGMAEM